MSDEDDKRSTWDLSAFDAHFAAEEDRSQFQVGLGVIDSEKQTTTPMTSVLTEKRKKLITCTYVACPGRKFEVIVKEFASSQRGREYGFRVFIDKGRMPADDEWNSWAYFGHHERDEQSYKRTLQIKGPVRTSTSSYGFSFEDACDGASPAAPVTRTALRGTKRGPAALAPSTAPADVESTEEKQGWIVLRFYQVKVDASGRPRFLQVVRSSPQARPSSSSTSGDLKPGVLKAQAGAIIESGKDYGKEPVFDTELIYEARIRYLSFERIQSEVSLSLVVIGGNNWFRAMPLDVLVSNASIRQLCIERILMVAQKKEADDKAEHQQRKPSSFPNQDISLKQLLLEIGLNFDTVATQVLCLQPSCDELLYAEAAKQFLQGAPLSEAVARDAVDFNFPLFTEDLDKILLEGLAKAADVGGVWYDILELRAPRSSLSGPPDPAKLRVSKKVIEL